MGKTARGKEKVKAKIAAAKKKIARKVKGSVAIMAAILSLVLYEGCSTATPASRATSASYEINVKVCMDENVKSATVNVPFTFGDGALASADSSGSTETQTATPTLDIKPDINVNYAQGGGITNRGNGGGATGAAGVLDKLLGSLTDEGLAALKSALANKTNGKITLNKKDGTTTTATCANGTCTFENGTTVTAEDCADCSTD